MSEERTGSNGLSHPSRSGLCRTSQASPGDSGISPGGVSSGASDIILDISDWSSCQMAFVKSSLSRH